MLLSRESARKLAIILLTSAIIILIASPHHYHICGERLEDMDLLPPKIIVNYWNWSSTNQKLIFEIYIEEEGYMTQTIGGFEVSSRIIKFGVEIILKAEESGDTDIIQFLWDPITKQEFFIVIDIRTVIGGDGRIMCGLSWEESERQGYGSGNFMLLCWGSWIDDRHAYMNGSVTFGHWRPGKYFILFWALDTWCNARIVYYKISDYVHSSIKEGDLSTTNWQWSWDPEHDGVNHYYIFGDKMYVPYSPDWYYGDWPEPDFFKRPECFRGLHLTIPRGNDIRIGEDTIESSDTTWAYYSRRIEWLFMNENIMVGDKKIFLYKEPTIGHLPLTQLDCLFMLLTISGSLLWLALRLLDIEQRRGDLKPPPTIQDLKRGPIIHSVLLIQTVMSPTVFVWGAVFLYMMIEHPLVTPSGWIPVFMPLFYFCVSFLTTFSVLYSLHTILGGWVDLRFPQYAHFLHRKNRAWIPLLAPLYGVMRVPTYLDPTICLSPLLLVFSLVTGGFVGLLLWLCVSGRVGHHVLFFATKGNRRVLCMYNLGALLRRTVRIYYYALFVFFLVLFYVFVLFSLHLLRVS